MPDRGHRYATIISGSTRVPLALDTEQSGELAWRLPDRTPGRQREIEWSMGSFEGGMGQSVAYGPTKRYLSNRNWEVNREGLGVAGRAITSFYQVTAPWTVQDCDQTSAKE